MLDPKIFFETLSEHKVSFFAGVPDSLLKNFCDYVTAHVDKKRHVIAANEGGAVALAAGHHLATGEFGLVYMQNSGFGNTINPLTSLVNAEVYSIPMLLMIGWRGEPGKKDEPQHTKMGKTLPNLLQTLGIGHSVLPADTAQAMEIVGQAISKMKSNSEPYALIVPGGTFGTGNIPNPADSKTFEMKTADALQVIVPLFGDKDIIVATTGQISRELFEIRKSAGSPEQGQDFLNVGSMGHASQIALGMALSQPSKQVFCLDGDGAVLMHMGSMAVVGSLAPSNFRHIVINNGAHDSVGGQPTAAFTISIPAIAKACGYKTVLMAETKKDLKSKMEEMKSSAGPALLEVKVQKGIRAGLGRPTAAPVESKKKLMGFLKQ